jgi:hypothetical protein
MVSSTLLPPCIIDGRLLDVAEYRGNHTAFERAGSQRRYWLARGTAQTPAAAMAWMVRRVWETAAQLDGPARRPAEAWLTDTRAQRAALHRLRNGRPVTFNLTDDQARYEIFVQPVYGVSNRALPDARLGTPAADCTTPWGPAGCLPPAAPRKQMAPRSLGRHHSSSHAALSSQPGTYPQVPGVTDGRLGDPALGRGP